MATCCFRTVQWHSVYFIQYRHFAQSDWLCWSSTQWWSISQGQSCATKQKAFSSDTHCRLNTVCNSNWHSSCGFSTNKQVLHWWTANNKWPCTKEFNHWKEFCWVHQGSSLLYITLCYFVIIGNENDDDDQLLMMIIINVHLLHSWSWYYGQ